MFIGCGLVLIAFVLLRFFFTCPKSMWNRLNPTLQDLFFYSQHIVYWGLLIAGLVLCFLSGMKIGLLSLGCFLVLYYKSIDNLVIGRRIPFLHNLLAGLIGIISLLLGLILLFITSLKYGFIALGTVLLSVQVVKLLMCLERNLIEKQVHKY